MEENEYRSLIQLLLPMLEKKAKDYAVGLLDDDEIGECLQLTLTYWWKRKDDLDKLEVSKIPAYFYRILKFRTIDRIRGKSKVEIPYREGSVPSWKYSPETVLSRGYQASQRERLVEVCLDEIEKLGAKSRQVLHLKYLQGVPDAEIRAQMGYRATSVHPHGGQRYDSYTRVLIRARALLKERVLARLRDAKDPLFDLVSDNELPFYQTEEL